MQMSNGAGQILSCLGRIMIRRALRSRIFCTVRNVAGPGARLLSPTTASRSWRDLGQSPCVIASCLSETLLLAAVRADRAPPTQTGPPKSCHVMSSAGGKQYGRWGPDDKLSCLGWVGLGWGACSLDALVLSIAGYTTRTNRHICMPHLSVYFLKPSTLSHFFPLLCVLLIFICVVFASLSPQYFSLLNIRPVSLLAGLLSHFFSLFISSNTHQEPPWLSSVQSSTSS